MGNGLHGWPVPATRFGNGATLSCSRDDSHGQARRGVGRRTIGQRSASALQRNWGPVNGSLVRPLRTADERDTGFPASQRSYTPETADQKLVEYIGRLSSSGDKSAFGARSTVTLRLRTSKPDAQNLAAVSGPERPEKFLRKLTGAASPRSCATPLRGTHRTDALVLA
jgi:hypothetical protein